MYCENCGHKLDHGYIYCSECGMKISGVNASVSKNSNNILWIVLICVLGIPFLLGIIIFLLSFFIIVDTKNVKVKDNYNINEYYDYDNLNNSYLYNDNSIEVIKIK